MATVIVEEKSMTDKEYREEFYRLMAEIDAIRAGFKEKDERIAQLRAESAELKADSARIRTQVDAALDRLEGMK
jgi:chromosome segregation ATPase